MATRKGTSKKRTSSSTRQQRKKAKKGSTENAPKPKKRKRAHGNSAAVDKKKRQREFLDAFAACGNITRACLDTGISRRTVYNWKLTDMDGKPIDPEFMQAYDDAVAQAVELLEDEARRRAVEGDPTPMTIAQEREVVMRKSDTLLIFLLKAHAPEKYRERYEHKVNADVNVTGSVTLYMPDNGRGPNSNDDSDS